MDFEIGIVCGRCERLAPVGTLRCAECGASLALAHTGRAPPAPSVAPSDYPVDWEIPAEPDTFVTSTVQEPLPSPIPVPADPGPRRPLPSLDWEEPATAMSLTVEQLLEQAKNFACRACSSPVPPKANFCPRCGVEVPPEILGARAQLSTGRPTPKVRLILIHGEGVAGAVYHLDAEEQIVDRHGRPVFSNELRAKIFSRNEALVVRDEGSVDGVFVRVRDAVAIVSGDQFMVGDQLLRLDVDAESDEKGDRVRITQLLQGAKPGLVFRGRGPSVRIGREGAAMNLPDDPHVSASHCVLEERGGAYVLRDLISRNGTFIRLKTERALANGDYLFIGKRLLRLELS